LAHGVNDPTRDELAERKIAGGDRTWRKHRALDLPMGL
jgi:hypothetical protein